MARVSMAALRAAEDLEQRLVVEPREPLPHHKNGPTDQGWYACEIGEAALAEWDLREQSRMLFTDRCSGCIAAMAACAVSDPNRTVLNMNTGQQEPAWTAALRSMDPLDPARVLYVRYLREKGLL